MQEGGKHRTVRANFTFFRRATCVIESLEIGKFAISPRGQAKWPPRKCLAQEERVHAGERVKIGAVEPKSRSKSDEEHGRTSPNTVLCERGISARSCISWLSLSK